MTLYNCKSSGDQFRITKFDSDANVESSYLTDGRECQCPAGVRPTCRHRKMLPLFKASAATNGQAFYDFEGKFWLASEAEVEFEAEPNPMTEAWGEITPEEIGKPVRINLPKEIAPEPTPSRSDLRRI